MKMFISLFIFLWFTAAPVTAAAASADLSVETVGILGGQNLYFTYTTMGLMTDQFGKGLLDTSFAFNLTREVIISCKKSRYYFQKMNDRRVLKGEEAQLGKQMIEAYDALIVFANAFISVIETRNSETQKQLEKYKVRSWDKIQSVLKLDE